MNTLTIKSRKTGESFQFWMPTGGGYVRLGTGTTDSQICDGGGFGGEAVRADTVNFKSLCRKWYRQHTARL